MFNNRANMRFGSCAMYGEADSGASEPSFLETVITFGMGVYDDIFGSGSGTEITPTAPTVPGTDAGEDTGIANFFSKTINIAGIDIPMWVIVIVAAILYLLFFRK